MRRKLVKQGSATMMISLPSKWIKENNLGKGNEINLEELNRDLIISSQEKSKRQKTTIDISGYSLLVNRLLISLYIKGIEEIEVNFSDPKEIEDFQKRVINELIGFEIMKQGQSSILIKDITGAENQNVDEIVKRIFLVIDSMIEELVEAVEKKQDLKPIIDIDKSVNKFTNYCLRIVNKKGYSENKSSQLYSIVSILEEIGDSYKNLAREIKRGSKISKEQIEILKKTKESLSLFKELLFNFNKEDLLKFANNYETIKSKIKSKDFISSLLFNLNESIIKMNNHLMVISF